MRLLQKYELRKIYIHIYKMVSIQNVADPSKRHVEKIFACKFS